MLNILSLTILGNMCILTYDGSYEGWLTAVFDAYSYKPGNASIRRENVHKINHAGAMYAVVTNEEKQGVYIKA